MERITEQQEHRLLHYLDGQLGTEEVQMLEEELRTQTALRTRLEELRLVHQVLKGKARLEQPSKKFTELVMQNLDHLPQPGLLSPKNGLLLMCGMLVAVGALSFLLGSGVFDNMSGVVNLEQLPVNKNFIKNPLPAFAINGKWVINGIMVLGMGLAFVVLDRTVLKPFFERRSGMGF